MTVTFNDIRDAARSLDLSGRPLCVHASLRSFGRVEGGAPTVISGLLAESCTVLVPTFSYAFETAPLPHQRPARNGLDYDNPSSVSRGIRRIYTTNATDIEQQTMGAIPAAVLTMPERVRGGHPLCSFTAVGALAANLVGSQAPLDVYAPLAALAARQGVVVLMGVGVRKMTLLHLAEKLAGRNLFRRWANGPDGQPMMVEVGSCSKGFPKLEALLAPLSVRASVGASTWSVLPARETLDVAVRAIQRDPYITHCDRAECRLCDDAARGGPILLPAATEEPQASTSPATRA